jgi:hypothetical protein
VKCDNSFYIGKNCNDAEFLFLRITYAPSNVLNNQFDYLTTFLNFFQSFLNDLKTVAKI